MSLSRSRLMNTQLQHHVCQIVDVQGLPVKDLTPDRLAAAAHFLL